jgi:hypothetical protein
MHLENLNNDVDIKKGSEAITENINISASEYKLLWTEEA